jgi:hypothetical protein
MPEPAPVTPETLKQISQQLLGMQVPQEHLEAAAGLVNALAQDMRAFRQFGVDASEPALTYAAVEGQP